VFENWNEILDTYTQENHVFSWGENDCCLFAAKWVLLSTGQDFYNLNLNKYSDALEAENYLAELGFDTHLDLVDSVLSPINKRMARRGDIIATQQNALGICLGVKSIFLNESGLIFIPTLLNKKAWRVE
jgi:hypothetical protein